MASARRPGSVLMVAAGIPASCAQTGPGAGMAHRAAGQIVTRVGVFAGSGSGGRGPGGGGASRASAARCRHAGGGVGRVDRAAWCPVLSGSSGGKPGLDGHCAGGPRCACGRRSTGRSTGPRRRRQCGPRRRYEGQGRRPVRRSGPHVLEPGLAGHAKPGSKAPPFAPRRTVMEPRPRREGASRL